MLSPVGLWSTNQEYSLRWTVSAEQLRLTLFFASFPHPLSRAPGEHPSPQHYNYNWHSSQLTMLVGWTSKRQWKHPELPASHPGGFLCLHWRDYKVVSNPLLNGLILQGLLQSTLLSSENDERVSFNRTVSNSWLLVYTRKTLKWEERTPTKGSKCCLKAARVILLSTCTINPKYKNQTKQEQNEKAAP